LTDRPKINRQQTDRQTDRQTDGQVDGWTEGKTTTNAQQAINGQRTNKQNAKKTKPSKTRSLGRYLPRLSPSQDL